MSAPLLPLKYYFAFFLENGYRNLVRLFDVLSDVPLFFFPHATSDVALTSVMRSRTGKTRIIFLDLNLFFIVCSFRARHYLKVRLVLRFA